MNLKIKKDWQQKNIRYRVSNISYLLKHYESSVTILTSVMDPDLYGSASILIGWIRIRIENADRDLDPGGQKLTTKIKKLSCFEALDVLFRRLKASHFTWMSSKEAQGYNLRFFNKKI
jgi:hypothetical protein